MLMGTFHLLHGSIAEDSLQPLVQLTHPISGGCRQRIQECSHHDHILAGPSKGGELPLHTLHHHGLACLKHRFALEQVG
jgi:hypothetical protein